MKETIYILGGLLAVYIIGRLFAKGVIHEIEKYFQRNFNSYTKKEKENGTKTEK
jgi:hypothetical protein